MSKSHDACSNQYKIILTPEETQHVTLFPHNVARLFKRTKTCCLFVLILLLTILVLRWHPPMSVPPERESVKTQSYINVLSPSNVAHMLTKRTDTDSTTTLYPAIDKDDDIQPFFLPEPNTSFWTLQTAPYVLFSFAYLLCSAARITFWVKKWRHWDMIDTLPFQCCLVVGHLSSALITFYTSVQPPDQTTVSLDVSPETPLDAVLLSPPLSFKSAPLFFSYKNQATETPSEFIQRFKHIGGVVHVLGAFGLVALSYWKRYRQPSAHNRRFYSFLLPSLWSILSAVTFMISATTEPMLYLKNAPNIVHLKTFLLLFASCFFGCVSLFSDGTIDSAVRSPSSVLPSGDRINDHEQYTLPLFDEKRFVAVDHPKTLS